MEAVNYSDLRNHLKVYMDPVWENHEPLVITRKNKQNIYSKHFGSRVLYQ